MNGQTSDEVSGVPQHERNTDSKGATKTPAQKSGGVQENNAQPNTGPATGTVAEQTVSDPAIPADGTGKHGRPTDDSDPGHS